MFFFKEAIALMDQSWHGSVKIFQSPDRIFGAIACTVEGIPKIAGLFFEITRNCWIWWLNQPL